MNEIVILIHLLGSFEFIVLFPNFSDLADILSILSDFFPRRIIPDFWLGNRACSLLGLLPILKVARSSC